MPTSNFKAKTKYIAAVKRSGERELLMPRKSSRPSLDNAEKHESCVALCLTETAAACSGGVGEVTRVNCFDIVYGDGLEGLMAWLLRGRVSIVVRLASSRNCASVSMASATSDACECGEEDGFV